MSEVIDSVLRGLLWTGLAAIANLPFVALGIAHGVRTDWSWPAPQILTLQAACLAVVFLLGVLCPARPDS